MAGTKKFNADIEILGKATLTGAQTASGTGTQVFLDDGTLAPYGGTTKQSNGWIYFNAAYKNGLTYSVTGEYILNGILYTLRQADLTVTSDPTNPVIHVIGADDNGNLIIIPGTPAPSPSKPTVDPATQLEGTFVTVSAGATVPDGIIENNVYFENVGTGGGEWNTAVSGGTIVTNGTAINGTVAIEGTSSLNGHRVTFTPSGDIDLEANPLTHLNFLIQNKAAVNGKNDTHRFVLNGLDGASNPVSIALEIDPSYSLTSTSAQFLSLKVPDFTVIKTLQNLEFVVVAKSAFGFYLDDIRFVESDQAIILDKYALIEYVDQRDNYIISLIGGSSYGEPEVVGTAREYTKQQNQAQVTLTDSATLSWDLVNAQSAKLTATSGVGDLRTLPNSVLTAAVEGGNYQLTFIQDATGGRTIDFDTNFVTVGAFDVRANQVTIITINVQDGIGYACINSFEGLVSGLSNSGAGVVLLSGSNIKSLVAGTNMTITDNGADVTFDASGGSGGGPAPIAYVRFDGNDGTGAIGSYTTRFATIAAAYTALRSAGYETGGEIHVGDNGGTYPINSTMEKVKIYVTNSGPTVTIDNGSNLTEVEIEAPFSTVSFVNSSSIFINGPLKISANVINFDSTASRPSGNSHRIQFIANTINASTATAPILGTVDSYVLCNTLDVTFTIGLLFQVKKGKVKVLNFNTSGGGIIGNNGSNTYLEVEVGNVTYSSGASQAMISIENGVVTFLNSIISSPGEGGRLFTSSSTDLKVQGNISRLDVVMNPNVWFQCSVGSSGVDSAIQISLTVDKILGSSTAEFHNVYAQQGTGRVTYNNCFWDCSAWARTAVVVRQITGWTTYFTGENTFITSGVSPISKFSGGDATATIYIRGKLRTTPAISDGNIVTDITTLTEY